jgi:hypothetical protein
MITSDGGIYKTVKGNERTFVAKGRNDTQNNKHSAWGRSNLMKRKVILDEDNGILDN